MPVKEAANDTETAAAANPRQEVESCIVAGVSKEQIFRMLETVYDLEPEQCKRLYFLVEAEFLNGRRDGREANG
jgi:hypothetical protein